LTNAADSVEQSLSPRRRLEEAVLTVLGHSGVDPAEVGTFIHGSTVVINAITERRGARTALVTTRGFRDVLEITRANRPDLYNLRYQKPVPFVERSHRLEVTERVSYRGDEIAPLDLEELADVVTALAELNVEAAAVAFLHSWVNPVHEEAAAAYLRAALPGVKVVASSEVSRQWREYERTNTAVLSAYVQPVVATYLAALEGGLGSSGIKAQLFAMQSAGASARSIGHCALPSRCSSRGRWPAWPEPRRWVVRWVCATS